MIAPKANSAGRPARVPRATLRILAVVAFSLAFTVHRAEFSATSAFAGLLLFTWSMSNDRPERDSRLTIWAALGALVVISASWISRIGPPAPSEAVIRPIYEAALITAVLVSLISPRSPRGRRFVIGLCLGAVALSSVWILAMEWDSDAGTDVYLAHEAAGRALFAGESPYGQAVRLPDGNPYTPSDATIVGYSYPPAVLLTYATAARLGDGRVVSIIAWLGILLYMARHSLRRDRAADISYAVFLVLAATPAWTVILFVAWTEPLSLVLLFFSLITWRRKWALSAILLGLALASKQYFVLLTPILFTMRVERRVGRLAVAGGTAMFVLFPPLIVDADRYVTATVTNLLDIGFRPDTQSLPGLLAAYDIDLMIPRPMWFALVLLIGVVMGLRTRTGWDVAFSAVVVLGAAFWLGLAFANYWFLIAGVAAAGSIANELDLLGSEEIQRDLARADPAPSSDSVRRRGLFRLRGVFGR